MRTVQERHVVSRCTARAYRRAKRSVADAKIRDAASPPCRDGSMDLFCPTNLAQREILSNGYSASIASNNALRIVGEAGCLDSPCGGSSFRKACSAQTALASARTARRSFPTIKIRKSREPCLTEHPCCNDGKD